MALAQETIRILLANCRRGSQLRNRIASQRDLEVVGEVADAVDLFTVVPQVKPNVVILDHTEVEDHDLFRELLFRFPDLVFLGLPRAREAAFVGLLWPRRLELDTKRADILSVMRWAVREPSCLESAIVELLDNSPEAPEH